MQYSILPKQEFIQLELPSFTSTELTRGNVTNKLAVEGDIVVDTITALALFLSEAAKHGATIADIAKDGIKGIGEWAEILKLVPQLVPVLIRFYQNVIKNADDFYAAVQNITPEQKNKSVDAFVKNFDITNDKAEQAIEKSVSMILEIITLIKSLK
jgi:hypothetical protein